MAKGKQVRDGFLGDLPEELQLKIMSVHKLLTSTCDEVWKDSAYDHIRNEEWAKSAIEDFCIQPADNRETGSVRVYKQGKRNSCMIQLSGHVINHRNDIDHELLHDFFRHVHQEMKTKVRRQFDMRLTCESEHGEPFEGFDVWTSSKVAKVIWDSFEDKKTKKVKEMKESTDDNNRTEMMFAEIHELPKGLQEFITELNTNIAESVNNYCNNKITESSNSNDRNVGDLSLTRSSEDTYTGSITVTLEYSNNIIQNHYKQILEKCRIIDDSTKILSINESKDSKYFEIILESKYAEKLWHFLEEHYSDISENITPELQCNIKHESTDNGEYLYDPFMEANNSTPEYNTDMSEKEAKATLRTLSQNMINDMQNKKDYKVSQYTANIYANIITKNLLPLWATGFRKFTITLDSYQSFNTLEFRVPKMTQDFVSRFIQGRESINGFIHRHPEINIKMSPRIFHTMKNPDDAFNFFRAAIKYYNYGLEKYSDKLMVEAMKLNHELKHLIATTKLSGIITCPMQLLFVFDDVKMDDKDTFKISQDDINTVNKFIRNIYTRYAAPEKEKKQIVDDIREMVKALKESCDKNNENIRELSYLAEAVDDYLFGRFEDSISIHTESWITEQCDMNWIRHQKNPQVKYLQEKFGVKKLKKIPSDLVAYITIETEAIRDANDKMMISSYCLSKIEIVEWYIELLEVGSKKYIVPHSKPYLETLRTQLLACFKKIMEVKIINPNTRPIIDINYPSGYEG